MKMYKFTSEDFMSHGGMRWEVGKTNRAEGEKFELCTDGVLHCYEDPVLAVLLAPLHVDYENPRLIEVECSEPMVTDGLKFGCREQTMTREVTIPAVTIKQRAEWAAAAAEWAAEVADKRIDFKAIAREVLRYEAQ